VRALALLGLAIPLFVTLATAPRALAAAGPYEPNDSIPSAAGPLLIDQSYLAGIETPSDRDFYFFYVTSASPVQATLTLKNLGGGTETSGISAAIVDSLGNPIDAFAYDIGNGGEASATTTLAPQRYLVEVDPVEGSSGGIAYSLTTGGGTGAFGPYAQIAARCGAAAGVVTVAQSRLRRAQAKLQRALARVRLSLYGSRAAHRAARAAYRAAKARVSVKQKALKAAEKSQKPWCFIPQGPG
jgi:hypothetical protein